MIVVNGGSASIHEEEATMTSFEVPSAWRYNGKPNVKISVSRIPEDIRISCLPDRSLQRLR